MVQRLMAAESDPVMKSQIMSYWLKYWSVPWFLGAVDFRPGLNVLDIGSGATGFPQYLAERFGCTVDALDASAIEVGKPDFGLPELSKTLYPKVRSHFGLAGEDLLGAEGYDIVYCNSVLEHTYDTVEALDPAKPLRHINVLRDLVRMLRPGGLLLMNWDVYLDGIPHHIGWDFEADFWLLRTCGMRLADPRRRVRTGRYIYDHPDSLFFSPEAVMPFMRFKLPHGTSINAIWMKPGAPPVTGLFPRTDLVDAYFPEEETYADGKNHEGSVLSTVEIDGRFRAIMDQAASALGGKLFVSD